jgi:putative inorganic carbon (hco3(-)) transporter
VYRLSEAPVGLVVALATIAGTFVAGAARRIPMVGTTVLLILWVGYATATTLNAEAPAPAWVEWNRFSRIILMCFFALMLLQRRKQLEGLLWISMASVAFYGVKGGLFSILTRGNYRVWGPVGSYIEGNNELAVAELMVLPLVLYFLHRSERRWKRLGYYAVLFLTAVSVLFSYSRGAFVAIAGVAAVMIARSRYRFQAAFAVLVLGGLLISFVPSQWKERMGSIESYQTDESAQGRINAWQFAYNLAKARLFGGGFRTFTAELFAQYAPNPTDIHDAHSIYFEVMAEQGFPGLAIFLLILGTTLARLERLRRRFRRAPAFRWAGEMAEMLQFAVLAYMLGGAFLGLAYFDLYYYLVVAAILLELIATREVATERARLLAEAGPGPAGGLLPAPSG